MRVELAARQAFLHRNAIIDDATSTVIMKALRATADVRLHMVMEVLRRCQRWVDEPTQLVQRVVRFAQTPPLE